MIAERRDAIPFTPILWDQ